MEYTKVVLTIAVLVVMYQVTDIEAQVTLCDTAVGGCSNGACVVPPAATRATCNCSEGYTIDITNPNNCVDINECTDLFYSEFICGRAYGRTSQGLPDPYSYIQTGACINTAGGYACFCYNSFVAAPGQQRCVDPRSPIPTQPQLPQPQLPQSSQSLLQRQYYLEMLEELGLLDF